MKLDDILYKLDKKWSVSKLITPINLDKIGDDKLLRNWYPEYTNIDAKSLIGDYIDILSNLHEYDFNSTLKYSYIMKIIENIKILYNFLDRDGQNIFNIYKTLDYNSIDNCKEKLENIKKFVMIYCYEQCVYTDTEVQQILQNYINEKGYNYNTNIKNIVAKCSVQHKSKSLNIKKGAFFGKREVERLKYHEIDTHIYRALHSNNNGYLFEKGFDNYIELEEGLAIFNEVKHGYTDALVRAYIRNFVCEQCYTSSFEELYELTKKMFPNIDDDLIYSCCFRVKRGLKDFNDLGGYTKDRLYLSGYLKVEQEYNKNNNFINECMNSGKTNFEFHNRNIIL